MTTLSITVEQSGKIYQGVLAKIDKTEIGYEDHGILTAFLHCSWPGGGVSVGGYQLDVKGSGTAFGLDQIICIMETVGVDGWEKLAGKQVVLLFSAPPGKSTLGSRVVGIAGLLNDKVLVLTEHADGWRDR